MYLSIYIATYYGRICTIYVEAVPSKMVLKSIRVRLAAGSNA